jgi:hypothetical protein
MEAVRSHKTEKFEQAMIPALNITGACPGARQASRTPSVKGPEISTTDLIHCKRRLQPELSNEAPEIRMDIG